MDDLKADQRAESVCDFRWTGPNPWGGQWAHSCGLAWGHEGRHACGTQPCVARTPELNDGEACGNGS